MLQKSTGIERSRVAGPAYHRVITLFFQAKNARHEYRVPGMFKALRSYGAMRQQGGCNRKVLFSERERAGHDTTCPSPWFTSLGQSPFELERSLVTVNQAIKGNTTDKEGHLAEVRTVVKKK
jgi:hypothetical protein